MSDASPILEYANLAGQRERPTRHPSTIWLSLAIYVLAVLMYGTVEFYGWIKWTYEVQGRLEEHVIDQYPIVEILSLTLLLSICLAIAGLVHPRRKKWTAVVALLLGISGFFTFGIVS